MDLGKEILLYALPQLLIPAAFLMYTVRRRQLPGLAFFLILSLYLVFQVWVPVTDRVYAIHSFFGYTYALESILSIELMKIYTVGLAVFSLAYALAQKVWQRAKSNFSESVFTSFSTIPKEWIITILVGLQLFIWLMITLNLYASGIEIGQLLNFYNSEEHNILFSTDWRYPWIDTLSNALPVCLFLQFQIKKKIDARFAFLFFIWLIFSLLAGWRYRIILCFLFFLLPWLSQQKFPTYRLAALFFAAILFFSWLTLNRMAIAKRQFHLVNFRIWEMDITVFNQEFSNSRTFRATLQYLKEHPEHHSSGNSWPEYIRHRLKPKSEFANAERPKPWILTITKAWIPPGWPWNPNPAVTQLEEFYLTFGWLGMILAMTLLGFWAAWLDLTPAQNLVQYLKWILTALLFQWTTRGFFLFQIQITLACLLPFLVLLLALPYLPHARKSGYSAKSV